MVIGSMQKILDTQQETTIKLQDKEVSCTKTLGIIVDENLSWKEQISNI
jgi:hypothetical protein